MSQFSYFWHRLTFSTVRRFMSGFGCCVTHKQVWYVPSYLHSHSNKHWLQARDITLTFFLQRSWAWLVPGSLTAPTLFTLSASWNASSVSNLRQAAECGSLYLTITGQGHCLWLRHTAPLAAASFHISWPQDGLALTVPSLCLVHGSGPAQVWWQWQG